MHNLETFCIVAAITAVIGTASLGAYEQLITIQHRSQWVGLHIILNTAAISSSVISAMCAYACGVTAVTRKVSHCVVGTSHHDAEMCGGLASGFAAMAAVAGGSLGRGVAWTLAAGAASWLAGAALATRPVERMQWRSACRLAGHAVLAAVVALVPSYHPWCIFMPMCLLVAGLVDTAEI